MCNSCYTNEIFTNSEVQGLMKKNDDDNYLFSFFLNSTGETLALDLKNLVK